MSEATVPYFTIRLLTMKPKNQQTQQNAENACKRSEPGKRHQDGAE